jgi:hypothetical protein
MLSSEQWDAARTAIRERLPAEVCEGLFDRLADRLSDLLEENLTE